MLRDEHDPARQSVQSIAGERVPAVSSLRTHDFYDAVVVVPARGMHGHAGGLVDDDHLVVFVDDLDRLGRDGWFVAVERVADDIPVLDGRRGGLDRLAVELDGAFVDGLGVVLGRSIAELIAEDVEDLPPPPSLLAPLIGC